MGVASGSGGVSVVGFGLECGEETAVCGLIGLPVMRVLRAWEAVVGARWWWAVGW